MSNPIPYFSIPDQWAYQARCPVCSASPMMVVRRTNFPDQMSCMRCHSLFEIEENGGRIYFNALPGVLIGGLSGRWVTYPEVKQAVQAVAERQNAENEAAASRVEQPVETTPPPPESFPFREEIGNTDVPTPQVEEQVEEKPDPVTVPPPPPEPGNPPRPPDGKDVRSRAINLYALGNQPSQIKAILSRDPSLDKAEIKAVLDDLYGEHEARGRRQNTRVWVAIGVSLFILLLCLVIGLIGRSLFGNVSAGGVASPNLIDTLAANQGPAPLAATPIVLRETESGAASPACPQTGQQASVLFGGTADIWHIDSQDGSWFMVSRSPVNVHVPGGMNAVLVNISNAGVDNVPGPSTIQNVTSVSILCR